MVSFITSSTSVSFSQLETAQLFQTCIFYFYSLESVYQENSGFLPREEDEPGKNNQKHIDTKQRSPIQNNYQIESVHKQRDKKGERQKETTQLNPQKEIDQEKYLKRSPTIKDQTNQKRKNG
jgi:hypothetical protein